MSNKQSKKYVFIAKGIGITPFRSMIQYLVDENRAERITLFYIAKNQDEFIFKDLFEKASKQFGLEVIYLNNANGEMLNENVVNATITDISEPVYYISGPQETVQSYREMVEKLGAKQIKTDLFSGYD
jgi:ferredoxin-NADP reductase